MFEVTDNNGETQWINARHVLRVRAAHAGTHIDLVGGSVISCPGNPADIAAAVAAALSK